MTTAEVEAYADEEGLSTGASDINIAVRLRRKVIPKFEMDVGQTAWRRKTATIPVSAADREYDLPTDFSEMLEFPVYDLGGAPPVQSTLRYIGEDVPLMTISEANTTPGTPTEYWIKRLSSGTLYLRSLYLNCIPDAAATIRYGYLSAMQFADMTTSVELDSFIPTPLQWGLVAALRAELCKSRFGINDPRYQTEKDEYAEYVEKGITYAEPGRRNVVRRIKTGPL